MTPSQIEKLKPGDRVFWNDPDDGACSREYKIKRIKYRLEPGERPCGDEIVSIEDEDGSCLECFASELDARGVEVDYAERVEFLRKLAMSAASTIQNELHPEGDPALDVEILGGIEDDLCRALATARNLLEYAYERNEGRSGT